MLPASHLAIAKRFAAALDRCDFAEALGYLSPDCRYEIGLETLVGPDAIVASYRLNAEWGSRALQQVIYESEVEEESGGLCVLYIDRLTQAGQTHEYRCRQHLSLDDSGQIVGILHEELPGERAHLDDFFRRVGVRR
jgi:hypothetical protein